MKVKLKTNLGTNQFPDMPYKAGEEREVSDSVGNMLVEKRLADELVQLKAVPPIEIKASPPVAEEQPEESPAVKTSKPVVPVTKTKPLGGK